MSRPAATLSEMDMPQTRSRTLKRSLATSTFALLALAGSALVGSASAAPAVVANAASSAAASNDLHHAPGTDPSVIPPRLRLLTRQGFTPTAPEEITKPWDGPKYTLNYRGYNFSVPVLAPRNPNTTDGVSCSWQGCDDNYYLYGCWDYPKKAVVSFDDGPRLVLWVDLWTSQPMSDVLIFLFQRFSQYTGELLDILKKQNMTAVMCYLGMQMEKYPDMVKRTVNEGHELCIHRWGIFCQPFFITLEPYLSQLHPHPDSWNHGHMTEMTDEAIVDQLVETQEMIRKIAGTTAFWFRPPFGELDVRVKAIAEQLKFKFLFWYSDTEDWRWAFSNLTEQENGALKTYQRDLRSSNKTSPIFLAHDMHRGSNLVMPQVKQLAQDAGYELVTGRECTKKAPVFWNGLDWSWTPPTGTAKDLNLYQGRYDGVGGHNGKNIPPKDWVPIVFPKFAKQFENVTSILLGGKPGLVAGVENGTATATGTGTAMGTLVLVTVTATKVTAATGEATATTTSSVAQPTAATTSSAAAAVATTTSKPSSADKQSMPKLLAAIFSTILVALGMSL